MNKSEANEEFVRLEYEKAQDSAEHYNTMTWTLAPAALIVSFYILKFVWFDQTGPLSASVIISALGVYILGYLCLLIGRANQLRQFKYDICKKLEDENKQHFRAAFEG